MADTEINYTKEVLKSEINYGFIGVMAFLMMVVNFWGFLPLLLAGEIAALFIAQNPRVQRIIRARLNKDKKVEILNAEETIVKSLPNNYQNDFFSLRQLSEEIEKRAGELSGEVGGSGANVLLSGVTEKLSAFRFDYARMLQAHYTLSTRNYRNIEIGLGKEIAQAERLIEREKSQQVRHALAQNLNVLKQRLSRVRKLDELVRLLEARLQVVRNSLGLVQDEVYTFTDIASISGLVDNLLSNLNVSDEFRTAYEDVLNVEAETMESSNWETQLLGEGDQMSAVSSPEIGSPSMRERARQAE